MNRRDEGEYASRSEVERMRREMKREVDQMRREMTAQIESLQRRVNFLENAK